MYTNRHTTRRDRKKREEGRILEERGREKGGGVKRERTGS